MWYVIYRTVVNEDPFAESCNTVSLPEAVAFFTETADALAYVARMQGMPAEHGYYNYYAVRVSGISWNEEV